MYVCVCVCVCVCACVLLKALRHDFTQVGGGPGSCLPWGFPDRAYRRGLNNERYHVEVYSRYLIL